MGKIGAKSRSKFFTPYDRYLLRVKGARMKRFVFVLVCFVCSISLRASEATPALTQLHQQLMSLASTLTSNSSVVSVESKIKELEQVLVTASAYFDKYNSTRNPLFDKYRPQVKENFTRVFNELMNVAMAGGQLSLTKQQKEQIFSLVARFNRNWPLQHDILSFPLLVTQWDQQHKKVVAQPVSAVTPVEVAAHETAKVLAVAQAERAKIESKATTRVESAEAVRLTTEKEAQERKESKEEKELKAQREQEAAKQRDLKLALPVAQPVIEASEVAKRLSALEKILQDYKVALARALKSRMSQEEKNKLREQMVKNFVPLRKELSKYVGERSLQKNQTEQLKNLDKDYADELAIELH